MTRSLQSRFVFPNRSDLTPDTLRNSQAWRTYQGRQLPADKLYALINALSTLEERPESGALFDPFAPAAPARVKPSGKKKKHARDCHQLSLFGDNISSTTVPQQLDLPGMHKTNSSDIKTDKETSMMERCARDAEYYLTVYGIRKLLGLSNKKGLEKEIPYRCFDINVATSVKDYIPEQIAELQKTHPELGNIIGKWVLTFENNKINAEKHYNLKQKSTIYKKPTTGLRY